MQIDPKRSFDKDIRSIRDKFVLKRLKEVLNDLEASESLQSCSLDIIQLSNAFGYYRLRVGDYRLGFKLVESRLELMHFRHRKEFYRVFP